MKFPQDHRTSYNLVVFYENPDTGELYPTPSVFGPFTFKAAAEAKAERLQRAAPLSRQRLKRMFITEYELVEIDREEVTNRLF